MSEVLAQFYPWTKSLHIVAAIAWMAGLLYLPRLFVYHASAEPGSVQSETFKVMERRLLKLIMNPAMIATWVFGLLLSITPQSYAWASGWFHVKALAIVLLTGVHHVLLARLKAFLRDENRHSARYFRILNEVPTVLMLVTVVMVVVKPF